MTDQTGSIICFGLALVGIYLIARGSRRARLAAARTNHPAGTALQLGHRAAAAVEAANGCTAWFKCAVCRERVRLENLTPDELLAICDDRTPTCPSCAGTLAAAERELTA